MVAIEWFEGPREALADLFELADDSPSAVSGYRDLGRVLVAVDGPSVIGHLQLIAEEGDEEAEIKSLAVREDRQGEGIGRMLVERAVAVCRAERRTTLVVATAAADTRVLRFYQLAGFRLLRVERDVFTPQAGYPPSIEVDGIPLRDQVWLSLSLGPTARAGAGGGRAAGARLPLFCDTALAERIERAETQLITRGSEAAHRRNADAKGFAIPLAGGVASFAEENSPFNKVAGLGFGGVPTAAEWEEIEHAFGARGAAVQVELAHLVDPEVGAVLSGRGYRLTSFENVLGLSLQGVRRPVPAPGIEIRLSGAEEFDAWLDVVVDGFAHPDLQGLPSHEDFPRDIIGNAVQDLTTAAGVRRYIALRAGEVAGGASVRMADGVAQLTGAATAPAHRRHGVQSALLAARLADAADAGCDVAVVTTQPASKSQQNAQRQGFDLLYTRAVLIKEP